MNGWLMWGGVVLGILSYGCQSVAHYPGEISGRANYAAYLKGVQDARLDASFLAIVQEPERVDESASFRGDEDGLVLEAPLLRKYVVSPWGGTVDVSGIPSGAMVRDPYSGRFFLNP